MLIIGEKIRKMVFESPEEMKKLKFDDLYYSSMIALKAEDEVNDQFFQAKSVQKLIDSQW